MYSTWLVPVSPIRMSSISGEVKSVQELIEGDSRATKLIGMGIQTALRTVDSKNKLTSTAQCTLGAKKRVIVHSRLIKCNNQLVNFLYGTKPGASTTNASLFTNICTRLIKHKYARWNITDNPVNTLLQPIPSNCTTNLDGPVAIDDWVQFQYLKSCENALYIKRYSYIDDIFLR